MRTRDSSWTRPTARRAVALLALGVVVACGAGCDPEPPVEARPVTKTHLVTLPADYREAGIAVSDDGMQVAFVVVTAAGERVVGPEGAGPLHARCERPEFAPGTHRWHYWAQVDADGPFMVVGPDGPMADGFGQPGTLVSNADGSRWAALGVDAASPDAPVLRFVLDGARQESWVDVSRPLFGVDDAELVLLARRDDGVARLVADGVPQRELPAPSAPCAVAALPPAGTPDLWRHDLHALPGGGLLLVTRDAEGWGIYRGRERIASYPLSVEDEASGDCAQETVVLLPEYLRVAAEAPVAFWWEQVRGDETFWRVVRDGAPVDEQECHDIVPAQPPELGPRGEHFAYACQVRLGGPEREVVITPDGVEGAGAEHFVVTDRARYGPYAELWGLALSDDGAHVAYGAVEDRANPTWSFYRDGEPQPGRHLAVWRPRLDAHGEHLAWQVQREQGPGGVIGLDAQPITRFDEILWGPEFVGDGRVAWVIRRGYKITRIDFRYTVD